jgi:hypothetical protein
MIALFYDFTLVKHNYLVCIFNGRQAVRYNKHRLALPRHTGYATPEWVHRNFAILIYLKNPASESLLSIRFCCSSYFFPELNV